MQCGIRSRPSLLKASASVRATACFGLAYPGLPEPYAPATRPRPLQFTPAGGGRHAHPSQNPSSIPPSPIPSRRRPCRRNPLRPLPPNWAAAIFLFGCWGAGALGLQRLLGLRRLLRLACALQMFRAAACHRSHGHAPALSNGNAFFCRHAPSSIPCPLQPTMPAASHVTAFQKKKGTSMRWRRSTRVSTPGGPPSQQPPTPTPPTTNCSLRTRLQLLQGLPLPTPASSLATRQTALDANLCSMPFQNGGKLRNLGLCAARCTRCTPPPCTT